ncbi:unnamed protein product [Mytilus coruscus]|uniref:Reverse transcriptase Ty1/copia-type domain-containing protein n=1 Tax=Mytilus coruscus TaxID=42192 RepID=A0A6J8BC46_MYTCO|nr:unnamed protein product [Mytilus coruscus]
METDDNEHQDLAPEAVDNLEQIVKQKDQQAKDIPHVGDEIVYKSKGNDTWVKAKVMSRGGKTSGKNWAYMNIQDENKDAQFGIDFSKDVEDWRKAENLDEANAVVVPQSLASTSEFDIHSIDIKAAFLPGEEFDRVIFVQPTKECSSDKLIAWKRNKCVYGLIDASRNWFLSVKKELLQLECVPSKIHPAVFYWHFDNHLEGLFLMHVDDFLWAGSELFKIRLYAILKESLIQIVEEN